MKKIKLIAAAIILCLLVAPFVFAGGKAEGQKEEEEVVKLTFMLSQNRHFQAYDDIADALRAEENIDIEYLVIPDDQWQSLLKLKLSTGEVPDIFVANAPERYESLNVYENCVDLSNEPWVSRLVNHKMMHGKDGKIYALPVQSSQCYEACYYNKDIFNSLNLTEPQTMEEFFDMLETVKNSGTGIIPWYGSDKASWTTQIFMTAGLPVLLGDRGPETWDKLMANKMKWADIPEFKDLLYQFLSIYEKGYANKDHLSADYDLACEVVGKGEALLIFNGEWCVSEIERYGAEVGTFVMPFREDKKILSTGAYVDGFFIPKASPKVEAAKKALNLMSQPKYLNIYYEDSPGFPGFKDVDGGPTHPAVQKLVDEYIASGQWVNELEAPPLSFVSAIMDSLWTLYVEMISGGKTPEGVLEAWDEKFADFMTEKEQPGW